MPNITPPPVPTQSQMTNTQGLVSRPWLSWFTTLGQIFGFNQTIQAAGVAVPQQVALNFLPPLTAVDNAANGSTDVGVDLAVPVAGADGTVLALGGNFKMMWGQSLPAATGGATAQVAVAFPEAFTAVPVVVCSPDNQPNPPHADPFTCYPSNVTEAGFTANFTCPVLIGGSGAPGIESLVHCNWTAFGS